MIHFLCWLLFPFQLITGEAQGTTYSIKYVADHEVVSKREIDSIFKQIDHSLSLYQPSSLINTFNARGRVLMDEHMKRVILASIQCYRESGGAFDITSATLSSLWGFGVNNKHTVPSLAARKEALSFTGSHLLKLKGDSLIAAKMGVKIDCNGIAQGYTVDVIRMFLISKGVSSFMVEVGGEIYVQGAHPETGSWKIGVESAEPIAGNWYPVQKTIELKDRAISTSGISRKMFEKNGRRYSHIIDPRKGRPIHNNILAVTVIASDCITADAWDNALMVMGLDKVRSFSKQHADLEIYLLYQDEKGQIASYSTIKK